MEENDNLDIPINENEDEINEKDNEENKEEKNKKNNKVDKKEDNEEINKIKKNKQECVIRLGGDIMYAITFLGRIIFTLYSFHGLFFIYNFIIQYIILVPGILYDFDSKMAQFSLGCIYLLFAVCTSNILVIPTFEFFNFPFLHYRNPFAHFQSFYYIIEDKEFDTEKITRENNNYINSILLFVEILYSLGYALGLGSITVKVKDFIKIIVLFLIYLYYLIIFLNYILISFYLLYKLVQDSIERNKQNNGKSCCGKFCDIVKGIFDFEKFFEKRKPIPEINLLSYVVNPLIKKNYNIPKEQIKKYCEDRWDIISIILRVLLLFLSTICSCVIVKKDASSIFFFVLFFLIMSGVSVIMNFQCCFRNKKTFGHFWSPKIEYKVEMKSAKMVSTIRFFCFIISLLASVLLFYTFFFVSESDKIEEFPEFSPSDKIINKTLLLPNICSSSIHSIPIYLFLPFINDAYYYNNNPKISPNYFSSLNIKKYRELFFDDSYDIKVIGNLIENNDPESVKMIQYDVKTPKDELTILSIKGTSHKRDIYLDFQLYFPSILLNILSTFSIFGQQKETLSFKFIEYSLSIPYRLFSQYLIVDGYLEDLKAAYIKNQEHFKNNIVIVGHSLGGGLCKILGRLVKQQAISLSGPGVNAFHNLWKYEGQSENFEISAIDLVPDMDLVPRVEVSGGTIYRIVCKEGPLDCHSKVLSLCEILIMCRNPNYEDYCRKMANLNDKQINSIFEDSELN